MRVRQRKTGEKWRKRGYDRHLVRFSGTSGRTRTVTPVKEPDFESGVSTNFTTLAILKKLYHNTTLALKNTN